MCHDKISLTSYKDNTFRHDTRKRVKALDDASVCMFLNWFMTSATMELIGSCNAKLQKLNLMTKYPEIIVLCIQSSDYRDPRLPPSLFDITKGHRYIIIFDNFHSRLISYIFYAFQFQSSIYYDIEILLCLVLLLDLN